MTWMHFYTYLKFMQIVKAGGRSSGHIAVSCYHKFVTLALLSAVVGKFQIQIQRL